ncbi:MAG: PA0069 family radical SAM protein [Pseudomonadota bacterium]
MNAQSGRDVSFVLPGRGTSHNPGNRYHENQIAPTDESIEARYRRALGEEADTSDDRSPGRFPTTHYHSERARSIISRNQSPDIPFDQSINPYRGCEHGCIYCYARPTHAYWDFSPGLDFETEIVVKHNAPELLRQSLSKPTYRCRVITIGANTDPYQPAEARFQLTRQMLTIFRDFQHPVSLITKSSLVERDIDLLAELAAAQLCSVAVSVTTLDASLKRVLEPRAASGRARVETIRKLADAGIPVTVMAAPMIPKINDHELEDILGAAREAGARASGYIMLRLPLEVAPLFKTWLIEHFPERAHHVMSIVQQSRAGRDYVSTFHQRMRGSGHFADLLKQRFELTSRRLRFENDDRWELDCSRFRVDGPQLGLF